MITLKILDYNGKYIRELAWQTNKPVPNKGDTLLILVAGNEYRVNVLRREFDCSKTDVINIVTDYVEHMKGTEDL